MTLEEAMDVAARGLDEVIERQLVELEARLRVDVAATGPEDEDALDRPPDPESPWQRMTVEEVIERERARLHAWRRETLAALRRRLMPSGYDDGS